MCSVRVGLVSVGPSVGPVREGIIGRFLPGPDRDNIHQKLIPRPDRWSFGSVGPVRSGRLVYSFTL